MQRLTFYEVSCISKPKKILIHSISLNPITLNYLTVQKKNQRQNINYNIATWLKFSLDICSLRNKDEHQLLYRVIRLLVSYQIDLYAE